LSWQLRFYPHLRALNPGTLPKKRYYLVASNTKLAYWQGAAEGLASAASKLGLRAEMVGPTPTIPRNSARRSREPVAAKPTGIMISAADPEMMTPDINAAMAAGIPVITMDSDAPAKPSPVLRWTNNYQAGFMAGGLWFRS